jgi:hypothetical protein
MPAAGAQQLPKEALYGFVGIDLKHDPISIADHAVMRAINADLHTQVGTMKLRAGRSSLGDTGSGSAIRTMALHNTRRYQVAGTNLYRNFISISSSLSASNQVTGLAAYEPLNDTTTWSFIADPAGMYKDDGTNLYNWGLTAPAAAPVLAVGAAGSLNGTYGARYTYARVVGGVVVSESNPCPAPTGVALTNQQLNIPVVASTDPQITHIRVYRTLTNGTSYLFDQQVANATATIVSSQADTGLGTAVSTDNDVPPNCFGVAEFQGSLFLVGDATHPDYLWYSKQYQPEAVSAANYLKIGNATDPLRALVPLTGVLGVFSRLTKFRVFGNSVSGFTYLEALSKRGIADPKAYLGTSRGAVFVAHDGLFLTNFVEPDVELSQALQPLFYGQTVNGYAPINWSATSLTLAEYKRRLYFGYTDTGGQRQIAVYSYDTQHWYHYYHSVYTLLYEEANDALTMGDDAGKVWNIETGTQDNGGLIALTADLPTRAGSDRFVRKGYEWLGVDSQGTNPWNVTLSIDGSSVGTYGFSGTRQKRYVRLPEQTSGQQWQASVAYTGADSGAALYGVEVIETTHTQGQVWVEDPNNGSYFLEILPGTPPALPLVYRRFQFLKLDADAADTSSASGTWTADLYVDGSLAVSVPMPHPVNRFFHRIPGDIRGYEHYIRLRYSSSPAPLVYSLQAIDSGVEDGQVWVAVTGAADTYHAILPAQQRIDATRRKRFMYMRLNAEGASTTTWTLQLYVDGALRYTKAVAGDRNRDLIRLPSNILGYTWYVVATYSATVAPAFYGVEVLTQELRPA